MTADLPEPLDGPEYADVAARVLGGWNAGLTGDHAARLVATVEATRRVVDELAARAEKAEADYAICFEEWGNSVRAAGERNAELFIRANEAEIRAQAADVLRARLAAIGDVTDDMVTAAWDEFGSEYMPFMARCGNFTREQIDNGELRAADNEAEAMNNDLMRRTLAAALAVAPWGLADAIPSRADVEQQAGRDEGRADA